jgi:hypothetical protein
MLDTERVGTRGKPDNTECDVTHPKFYVQCKRRAKLQIATWWKETKEGAEKADKGLPTKRFRES